MDNYDRTVYAVYTQMPRCSTLPEITLYTQMPRCSRSEILVYSVIRGLGWTLEQDGRTVGELWGLGWHHSTIASHPHHDLTVPTLKNTAKTAQNSQESPENP